MQSSLKFALWLKKFKQGLCINLEGWDGVGDGREVHKGEDIHAYGWFMLRFDRKQQNSVKQLSFNKKINLKKIAISWTFPQIYWIRIAEAWNHKPLPGKMTPGDTVAGGEWICLWKSLSSSVSFTPWSKENVHRRMNLNMWYKYMDCMPSLYSCYHSHWLEFKGGECSLSWISTGLHRPARKE